MGLLKPATPGTIVVLAATVLLILVSLSVPIIKSIYFLQADFSVPVGVSSVNGTVTLGCWGFCVTVGASTQCAGPRYGYQLTSQEIFGTDTSIDVLNQLPNTLIQWLTYALILNPIAAAFALGATIMGCLAHFRAFALTSLAIWFASLGTFFTLLAFVFDMVVFNIAKSRIQDAQQGASASLGNANWLTVAALALLFLASCAFGFGRRVVRQRPTKDENERMRPAVDPIYATHMSREARLAQEKREYEATNRESGLPKFAESIEESIPLTDYPGASEDSEHISGVGMGYGVGPGGRRIGSSSDFGPPLNGVSRRASESSTELLENAARPPRSRQSSTEPFQSMYPTATVLPSKAVSPLAVGSTAPPSTSAYAGAYTYPGSTAAAPAAPYQPGNGYAPQNTLPPQSYGKAPGTYPSSTPGSYQTANPGYFYSAAGAAVPPASSNNYQTAANSNVGQSPRAQPHARQASYASQSSVGHSQSPVAYVPSSNPQGANYGYSNTYGPTRGYSAATSNQSFGYQTKQPGQPSQYQPPPSRSQTQYSQYSDFPATVSVDTNLNASSPPTSVAASPQQSPQRRPIAVQQSSLPYNQPAPSAPMSSFGQTVGSANTAAPSYRTRADELGSVQGSTAPPPSYYTGSQGGQYGQQGYPGGQ